MINEYQAKYYAYELTRKRPSGDLGKLTASLQDAQVDLNPHQIEAALFAFKSPFSRGAILADEVGLGKTIEAAIILAQKWAENKRKLLVICPASLRKQWSQELAEKFFLPSSILEKKSFDETIKTGNLNPFEQEKIIICSYHFVKSKEPYVDQIDWDLVVIDEAHRLRNVYRPQNKIANAIKRSVEGAPKVLLTATPLQNSLLELYGLVSIIDEHIFGDLKSFKSQYSRLVDNGIFHELKERLSPVCKRTLRRQVLEYINYTNRIPMVVEFKPFKQELQLYDEVSEYLTRPVSYALPASQRQLITLILRKLLASSTYAISGTMLTMKKRLEALLERQEKLKEQQDLVSLEQFLSNEYEDFDDLEDEWLEDEEDSSEEEIVDEKPLSKEQIEEVKAEIALLDRFYTLANNIQKNSKGEQLRLALNKGFEKLEELGANKKAIIFTESTRTQIYIQKTLEEAGYKGKIVLFNGSNSSPETNRIYKKWKKRHEGTDRITGAVGADKRQAIIEYFKNEAIIMIATEAAAEGINLQFCSLVINYDLPWNPQRIEQRIGRCHRYGQKFDVVVINFLNRANEADQRVYQLLDEKFKLFSGVFGASDEILGAIGSGIDFEKRIARIYQECRRAEDIKKAFDQLQEEFEPTIEDSLLRTKQKLLENFDEEVHQLLKVNLARGREYLSRYEQMLWHISEFGLRDVAVFDEKHSSFLLTENPFEEAIHLGKYFLVRNEKSQHKTEVEIPENANIYRVGHPLAKALLKQCKSLDLLSQSVQIDLTNAPQNISVLEEHIGKKGWMQVSLLSLKCFETEEYLLLSCITDEGEIITGNIASRMFGLPQNILDVQEPSEEILAQLQAQLGAELSAILTTTQERNSDYYNAEIDKLDKWAEDLKLSLEKEIKDLGAEISLKKSLSRKTLNLSIKVGVQREIKELERQRTEKRRNLYEAQDEIELKKEKLLDEIEERLKEETEITSLFTFHWELK